MRIDRDLLGWGVFFLVGGAVAIGIQGGFIADRAWWSFWPLILVGIGVALIARGTVLDLVGGLIVAATFGVMVGGSLAGGIGGIGAVPSGVCGPGDAGAAVNTQTGTLGPRASVDVELDCGDLVVRATPGGAWVVSAGDDAGREPQISADEDRLEVRSADEGPTFLMGERAGWTVEVPTQSQLELDLGLNAGTLRADLSGARLGTLAVELNAGQATVDLTGVSEIEGIEVGLNAGSLGLTLPSLPMTGSIEANAGSIRLCAPPDVALRLRTGDSVLASRDFGDAGLVEVGGAWETPGYDTATTRIDLRTEANAGNFRLDPEEGCS